MEDINRIEIYGTVGCVRVNEISGSKVVSFSVRTDYGYINTEGYAICESTWHTAVATQGDAAQPASSDVSEIQTGARIRLTGRMRNSRYISADGSEKMFAEIVVQSFLVIGK